MPSMLAASSAMWSRPTTPTCLPVLPSSRCSTGQIVRPVPTLPGPGGRTQSHFRVTEIRGACSQAHFSLYAVFALAPFRGKDPNLGQKGTQ